MVAVGKYEEIVAVPVEVPAATVGADPDLAAAVEVAVGVAAATAEPCSPEDAIWHEALLVFSPDREAGGGELEGKLLKWRCMNGKG